MIVSKMLVREVHVNEHMLLRAGRIAFRHLGLIYARINEAYQGVRVYTLDRNARVHFWDLSGHCKSERRPLYSF